DVRCDFNLLAGLEPDLFFARELIAREAEEDQHDAEVHDVPAVAPARSCEESDERGEDVDAGRVATDERGANELLRNADADERTQREAQTGRPERHAKHRQAGAGHETGESWPQQLFADIRERRLAPPEKRREPREEQQDEP